MLSVEKNTGESMSEKANLLATKTRQENKTHDSNQNHRREPRRALD